LIRVKARLIANPTSGTDAAAAVLPALNQRLRQRLGDLDIVLTVAPADAERAARQAAELGYERLYVAGGDGTLNEVINGAATIEGALGRLTFGLIPLGTGNDLAQSLGLPPDPEQALDLLALERVATLDLGALNGRLFANASAGGFIAEVSDAVSPELKTLAGRLAYLIGGAQVLLDHEPLLLRLQAGLGDPGPARGPAHQGQHGRRGAGGAALQLPGPARHRHLPRRRGPGRRAPHPPTARGGLTRVALSVSH
jgi:diacylglycerol kinase (ATP)